MLNPSDEQLLVDVRTPTEVLAGTISGAINIPVDQLRSRLMNCQRIKNCWCSAASMGSDVTMFFTFWGLNVLRKETPSSLFIRT